MKVFLSHSSKDKPAVEALARALIDLDLGFDPWLDKWEILGGDSIVARINEGLARSDAGLIMFSEHTEVSKWVGAEADFLTLARVEDGRKLIPVRIGDKAQIPPLLRPMLWKTIEDVQGIADALLNRSGKPAIKPRRAADPQITIRLRTTDSAGGFTVEVAQTAPTARVLGSTSTPHAGLSAPLQRHLATFRAGFGAAAMRDAGGESGRGLEAAMREFGQMLGALCLPGDSGAAVAALIDALPGAWLDIAIEADGTDLLGLPFEAMRLPDGRLLAQQPGVAMWRRPAGLHQAMPEALAGPLKVLVAVGAPDEGTTNAVVLDQERELQNLLDAVEETNRQDNAQVRFLEVGSPQAIGEAVARDAFHVLHLSCHGKPGELELEDEDGRAVQVPPATLLAALREPGRPLPLVLLNTCHGGVLASDGTASFAEALLRAGVPAVLAMQTSVSDHYATALARHFYDHLTRGEHLRPSRALASARRALEDQRQQAIQRGDASHPCTPEYATAALYLAGDADRPLADFGRDRVPLARRPQHDAVRGQVPMLRQDDLIGRRRVMRQTLRALRQPAGRTAGVVLTGIGGVGKSAVAGRVMQRLLEDGWAVAVHTGRLMLAPMAAQVGRELAGVPGDDPRRHALAAALQQPGVPDEERLPLLLQTLRECRVLLVLDDFEQNLTTGGERFHDPDTRDLLRALAESAHAGRLLLTCRHPVPGVASLLTEQTVGPLSAAEVRKLVLRLDGLHALAASELTTALKLIGGHPRMLELLDALLRRGQGRLKHVSTRLDALAERAGVSLKKLTRLRSLDEQLQATLQLGARDVFLDELLALSRDAGTDAALLQLAVSNLPVSAEGLARMLADDPADPGDLDAAEDAIEDLAALSLVYRDPDTGSAWVHRWTAEGLAQAEAAGHAERCRRAGHYRLWRLQNESQALDDAMEATRNFLAARAFDDAAGIAGACLAALARSQQLLGVTALAAEILAEFPTSHAGFDALANQAADAHLALGGTQRALDLWQTVQAEYQRRLQVEPDCADFQRDLSVSLINVGDLYLTLGRSDLARDAFLKSLTVAERLASNEPDRADFQRHLSISFARMGNLYVALGQSDLARDAFLKSLTIDERLASTEPDHAYFQRGISVSLNKVGDLYLALGQGDLARDAFLKSLAIRERLASNEPDCADFQRDLSVSFNKIGDLYRALGQGDLARDAFLKALAIAERLASNEPDRADFQRDLSVSFERMGDLYGALGQGDLARDAVLESLAIRERLVSNEPDRTDFQDLLSGSFDRMGDLYLALGQGDLARDAFLNSLAIREHLASNEPDRADFQHGLGAACDRMGNLYLALGQGDLARDAFLKSLAIAECIASNEPDRADFQRDLSVSFIKVGDIYLSLGEVDLAREAFLKSHAIAEHLASNEPDRADFQRDLSVSYSRMVNLYLAFGQGDIALDACFKSLAISERLAFNEPDRTDFQRDLFVSFISIGDIHQTLGQGALASDAFLKAVAIAERLASNEPDRADFQHDLGASFDRLGDSYLALDQSDLALHAYLKFFGIFEKLAAANPERDDLQRNLSITSNKVGDLYLALGQGDLAREYFLKDLAIAERLASNEPDRADFQRDLVVSHVKMASISASAPEAGQWYATAWQIVANLQAQGRWQPADDWMNAEFAKLAAENGVTVG